MSVVNFPTRRGSFKPGREDMALLATADTFHLGKADMAKLNKISWNT